MYAKPAHGFYEKYKLRTVDSKHMQHFMTSRFHLSNLIHNKNP